MKIITRLSFLLFSVILLFSTTQAQNIDFDAYKKFLEDNKSITTDGLFKLYPPGVFKSQTGINPANASYYSDVNTKFQLTAYEKQLIQKHSFMVTERISYNSFWNGFEDIYANDLPVFISTDAILHSIHMSYDAMLKDIESGILIPQLKIILGNMSNYSATLKTQYQDNPAMKQMLLDYDVYFTVALRLLNDNDTAPYYSENNETINDIMDAIKREGMEGFELFSSTSKDIDFSQFTVRGHYTDSKELGNYFKSMIWLGRTELYLIPPNTVGPQQTEEDIQRQIIDALLISKAVQETNLLQSITDFDTMIKTLVGEQDNVQLSHLIELMEECEFSNPSDLLDAANVKKFQDVLAKKPYSDQKILSQVLWGGGPFDTDCIKPASAFLLFGQRFVIDSYVTGNVVYDKIAARILPTSLDVLFVLGNNSSSDLLKKELNNYSGLARNLAGLRYLMDFNDDNFWNLSFYNNWLKSIKTLSPPDDKTRKKLPLFMQTAAWWQEKMNTQCAAWAQLRHDNLLYAKQSYTGGITCSYPLGYVEPIPEFFDAVELLAINAKSKLLEVLPQSYYYTYKVEAYFSTLESISSQLSDIAQKELYNVPLTDLEKNLLLTAYKGEQSVGCGETDLLGWYSDLFYNTDLDAREPDLVIADVHTAPTDEFGDIKGYVWHIGTGLINLAVVLAPNWDGQLTAFSGPVMSYYETVTLNFKRLTDEEWLEFYTSPDAYRPQFVDLYLARSQGNQGNLDPISLPTGVEEDPISPPSSEVTIVCKPNPFTDRVLFGVSIPADQNLHKIDAEIFNLNGDKVASLYNGNMPSSNYLISWEGKDINGNSLPNGVYIYSIKIDNKDYTGKVIYNK